MIPEAALKALPVRDGAVSLALPAQSIVTLVASARE